MSSSRTSGPLGPDRVLRKGDLVDPLTLAGVSLLLSRVIACACLVLARRVLAVDPSVPLRAD